MKRIEFFDQKIEITNPQELINPHQLLENSYSQLPHNFIHCLQETLSFYFNTIHIYPNPYQDMIPFNFTWTQYLKQLLQKGQIKKAAEFWWHLSSPNNKLTFITLPLNPQQKSPETEESIKAFALNQILFDIQQVVYDYALLSPEFTDCIKKELNDFEKRLKGKITYLTYGQISFNPRNEAYKQIIPLIKEGKPDEAAQSWWKASLQDPQKYNLVEKFLKESSDLGKIFSIVPTSLRMYQSLIDIDGDFSLLSNEFTDYLGNLFDSPEKVHIQRWRGMGITENELAWIPFVKHHLESSNLDRAKAAEFMLYGTPRCTTFDLLEDFLRLYPEETSILKKELTNTFEIETKKAPTSFNNGIS